MKLFKKISFFVISLLFSVLPISAKVKIVKGESVAKLPLTGVGSKYTPKLFCDGYDVLVKEVAGKTMVLIDENEDGVFNDKVSDSNNEIVELENADSWESVVIFLGGEHCKEGHTTKFTMTGGHIGDIMPISPKEENRKRIDGEISINISGGTFYGFFLTEGVDFGRKFGPNAKISILVNNATIEGCNFPATSVPDDDSGDDFFIGKDFTMFDNIEVVICNTKYTHSDILDYVNTTEGGGALYCNVDGTKHYAYGNVTIPEGVTINTKEIVLADENTHVTNRGNVSFSRCDGEYTYNGGTWSGNEIVRPEHERNMVEILPQTCTTNGQYSIRCLHCFKRMGPTMEKPVLGHNYLMAKRIEPTCSQPGFEAGEVCLRCGHEKTARTPINPTGDHNYVTLISKVPVGTYLCNKSSDNYYVQCTQCGKYSIKSNSGMTLFTHKFSDEYTSDNNKTCTRYGTKSRRCTNTNLHVRCLATIGTVIDVEGGFAEHNLKHYEGKAATCTSPGTMSGYKCMVCNQFFDENRRPTIGAVGLKPLGHDFTLKSVTDAARIHEANCEKPAEYHYSCSLCNAVDDNIARTFSVGKPLGHDYHIFSIEPSTIIPEEGTATLQCNRCNNFVNKFRFTAYKAKENNNDFSYSSKLERVITKPSCREGEGYYRLELDYAGCQMSEIYRAQIRPVNDTDDNGMIIEGKYLVHAWDNGGVCPYHPSEPKVAGSFGYFAKTKLEGADYIYRYYNGKGFETKEKMLLSSELKENYDDMDAKIYAEYELKDSEGYNAPFESEVTMTNVRYNRTVQGGSIETFVFPVTIPISCINGTVYKLINYDPVNHVLQFDEVYDIERNMPYIIKVDDNATTLIDNSKLVNVPVIAESSRCGDVQPWSGANTVVDFGHVGYYKESPIYNYTYEGLRKDAYYCDSYMSKMVNCQEDKRIPAFRTSFYLGNCSIPTPEYIYIQLGTQNDSPIIVVDTNNDNQLDVIDISNFINMLHGVNNNTHIDVNGDGVTNLKDLQLLINRILKK